MQNGSNVYAGDGGKTDFSGKHGLGIIQNDLEIFSSSHFLKVCVLWNLGMLNINFFFVNVSRTLSFIQSQSCFSLSFFFPSLELPTKRRSDIYILPNLCVQLPLVLMGVKCLLGRKTDPKVWYWNVPYWKGLVIFSFSEFNSTEVLSF